MRICAAADVHYPRFGREWSEALARRMCESDADMIVLAGDISAGPEERYREFLSLFEGFSGPKLFVPGNHDLWTEDETPATEERYHTQLPDMVQRHGFHYLPGNPLVLDGFGVVGTAGWWDFQFRQTKAPTEGLRVTPMRALVEERAIKLRPIRGRLNIPWQELTEEDYSGKALVWQTPEGETESLVWNDAVHTNWTLPDKQVAQVMAEDLARDIEQIRDQVDTLVGVSHFIPFDEMLEPFSDTPQVAYCRAFTGSPLLGDVFASEPKMSLVIFGHHHEQKAAQIGRIVAANCSVAQDDAGPLLLDVPGE